MRAARLSTKTVADADARAPGGFAEPASGIAVETIGLTKIYAGRMVLDGLSLSIPRGEVYGLLGPNGAGKSTTFRLLLGLASPTAGTAIVMGCDVTCERRRVAGRIGYCPEFPAVDGGRTALENLADAGALYGLSSRETARRAPGLVRFAGLEGTEGRTVRTFSKGMRQRLSIARALLQRPSVLLLDEPTSGLDPGGQEDVRTIIRRLAGGGITVLLSAHNLRDLETTCNRVGVLVGGALRHEAQIAPAGSVRTLDLVWDREPAGSCAATLGATPGVRAVSVAGRGARLLLAADARESDLLEAAASVGARLMTVEDPRRSLARLYRALVGEDTG